MKNVCDRARPWYKRQTKVCYFCFSLSSMEVKNVRQVLENVPLNRLAKEICKLQIPHEAHLRVIIETLEEQPGETIQPDDAELLFLCSVSSATPPHDNCCLSMTNGYLKG